MGGLGPCARDERAPWGRRLDDWSVHQHAAGPGADFAGNAFERVAEAITRAMDCSAAIRAYVTGEDPELERCAEGPTALRDRIERAGSVVGHGVEGAGRRLGAARLSNHQPAWIRSGAGCVRRCGDGSETCLQ